MGRVSELRACYPSEYLRNGCGYKRSKYELRRTVCSKTIQYRFPQGLEIAAGLYINLGNIDLIIFSHDRFLSKVSKIWYFRFFSSWQAALKYHKIMVWGGERYSLWYVTSPYVHIIIYLVEGGMFLYSIAILYNSSLDLFVYWHVNAYFFLFIYFVYPTVKISETTS